MTNFSFLLLLSRKIEVLIWDIMRYWQGCECDQKKELPGRFIFQKLQRLKVGGKAASCWDCAVSGVHFAIVCVRR